jgi:hypothetical protein
MIKTYEIAGQGIKNGYEMAGQEMINPNEIAWQGMEYARQRNEINLPGYLISYIHLGE